MTATLGQRLRVLRRERGLTLRDVAEASGLSVGYVNDLEHDRNEPKLQALLRLGVALDVTVVEVLAGIEPYDRADTV